MVRILFLVVLMFVSADVLLAQPGSLTTFILVRHAEKLDDGTPDPDLKPEGKDRADRLRSLLKETSIDGIYTTRYKRTTNTVAPVAAEKGLQPLAYQAVKPEFIDELIAKYAGGTVLIAGHSNTIPQIANLLIGKEEFKTFAEDEYGNILIISVVKRGDAKVVRLNY